MNDDFIIEELIISKCDRYLNRLREIYTSTGNKTALYRGVPNKVEDGKVYTFRSRSVPMNTNPIVHDISNRWFNDKFGIYARTETLFTTANKRQASEYGEVHYVFPVGGFSTIHSPKYNDLFIDMNRRKIKEILLSYGIDEDEIPSRSKFYEVLIETHPEELEKAIFQFLDNGDYVKGKSTAALLSTGEVMLKTKQFIIVPYNERFSEFMEDIVYTNDL